MIGPSELNGLPIHPLIVHVPVVFVPVALLGAIAALARPRWRSWLLPLVAGATGASVIAVQLAIGSGRELEDTLGESDFIERHEHLALQTRPMVIVFFLLAAAALYVDRRQAKVDGESGGGDLQARLAKAALPLAVLLVLSGGLATTWVARTGDAGSKATWEGQIGYSKLPAGGGGDEDSSGKGSGDDTSSGDDSSGKGSSDDKGSGDAKGGDQKVDIADFAFGPKEISIKVGDTITWTNEDSAMHDAKSTDGPTEFDTKDLGKGDSDSVTFDKAGTYEYECHFHTYMKGRVMVGS
ncbi:cupredoxin family copper-binding protein [Aquihabitans sp. G128]|uniref:cupredoxin domain-containing protein n=1 Tax=Aquihabitans sp. G128 TaxID=2849779 RepID=UPI001C217B9E|nr:cupredoxin family copper-binding protein [Aquihabitans sp. G128]QXC59379.1 cupredoxin family copper-binding protein [Aquihabitans sp. G128]